MKTLFAFVLCCAPAFAAPPNIVIILVDDLGWGDIGAHGGEHATPNIDRLFSEGCELKRMYAHPSCRPSRTELLTGTNSALRGVEHWREFLLPEDEPTIADMLADYESCHVGKWQVSTNPADHGFAEQPLPLTEDHRSVQWRDAMLSAIENSEPPFFIYSCPQAVHNPLTFSYGEEVELLDEMIGDVLAALPEDTVVIFASDNGANPDGGSSGNLRGHKHSTFDGGIRVPCALWGSRIIPGRHDKLQSFADILPLCLALAEDEPATVDDLLPDRTHHYVRTATNRVVIEARDSGRLWKLIDRENRKDLLYDLDSDPREQANLHRDKPEVVNVLRGQLP